MPDQRLTLLISSKRHNLSPLWFQTKKKLRTCSYWSLNCLVLFLLKSCQFKVNLGERSATLSSTLWSKFKFTFHQPLVVVVVHTHTLIVTQLVRRESAISTIPLASRRSRVRLPSQDFPVSISVCIHVVTLFPLLFLSAIRPYVTESRAEVRGGIQLGWQCTWLAVNRPTVTTASVLAAAAPFSLQTYATLK